MTSSTSYGEKTIMQAILTFELPEDESELRAAIHAMDYLGSIQDFRERLRTLNKYGHSFKDTDEAVSCLYSDYYNMMQAYLE